MCKIFPLGICNDGGEVEFGVDPIAVKEYVAGGSGNGGSEWWW